MPRNEIVILGRVGILAINSINKLHRKLLLLIPMMKWFSHKINKNELYPIGINLCKSKIDAF